MNLTDFKSLADKNLKFAHTSGGRAPSQEMFWCWIRSCFPSHLRAEALGTVRSLLNELAVRNICDGDLFQPYDNIARAMQWALNYPLDAWNPCTLDWSMAVSIAVQCHLHYPPSTSDILPTKSSTRAQVLSRSILGLRRMGYELAVGEGGLARMTDIEKTRLQMRIDCESRLIGGRTLLWIVLNVISGKYSKVTERFNLGRNFRSADDHADPHHPWAFAYQLALKNIDIPRASGEAIKDTDQFFDLLRFAVGILDLEDGLLGLVFEQQRDVLLFTQRSLQFDLNFVLTQANSRHVALFLDWVLNWPQFRDQNSGSIYPHDVAKVAAYLLNAAPAGHVHMERIWPVCVAKAVDVSPSTAEKILTMVFSHKLGSINRNLHYPMCETDVTSAFRPLLRSSSSIVQGAVFEKLPRSTASRAVMNASLRWIEETWKKKIKSKSGDEGFNEELGKALEAFVLGQFRLRRVLATHGKYKAGKDDGECDIVVETETHVVFVEIKAKQLTREARSYDTNKAVVDLAAAVAFPLAQAMEHHAHLIKRGVLELVSPDGTTIISLRDREVLKVAVCRGELLSLHDRPYLQHFLSAVFDKDITESGQDEESMTILRKIFSRFNEAAKVTGSHLKPGLSRFNDCWCLSLMQLLLILDFTNSADDFVAELIRTQRIHSIDRDTYSLYELVRQFEDQKKST